VAAFALPQELVASLFDLLNDTAVVPIH
jgi:hypothetical protein